MAHKTEPAWQIVPGDSCDKVRQLLGNESDTDDYELTWKERDMEISLVLPNPKNCVATEVLYSVNPGHTVVTPDGIVLGEDTIAAASKRLAQRFGKIALSVWQGEGQVHAALEIDSSADFPFWKSYDWSLDQRNADRVTREREPRLSDFTNEPVVSYSIDSVPPATRDTSVR